MAEGLTHLILRVSSLSDYEHFQLLANYEILSDKKWQCSSCMKKCLPDFRKVKGCHGGRRYTLKDGEREAFVVDKCVGNFWSAGASFWFDQYRHFKAGMLPFPGTVLQQPAKVMEIFAVIEGLEARRMAKEAEKSNGK